MSNNHLPFSHLRAFGILPLESSVSRLLPVVWRLVSSVLYNCRESSTNRPFFMQNKANLEKTQMNVSIFSKMAYENKSDWTLGENKPNSNLIKADFPEVKMSTSSILAKDYENKSVLAVLENKAKQSQSPLARDRGLNGRSLTLAALPSVSCVRKRG